MRDSIHLPADGRPLNGMLDGTGIRTPTVLMGIQLIQYVYSYISNMLLLFWFFWAVLAVPICPGFLHFFS